MTEELKEKIDYIGKDFIVVKDHDIGTNLVMSKIPSLAGKYIIVAPEGIEFLSWEELKEIPQIQTELAKERESMIDEILIFLDHLEINQPEVLKADNWRNWKYIRNSLRDKYSLSQPKKEGGK